MKKEKKPFQLGIRWYFVLLCMVGILGTLGISTLVAGLLNLTVGSLHPLVWVLILGMVIGTGASVGLNQLLLFPIMRLVRAMKQVSQGDFTVRLHPQTMRIREMADIYGSFNLMVKALSSTEMLQSDFISNVSHEFKTPITAIEGYAMLLQDGSHTPEQEGYIDKILFSTKRLSTLVGNILLLSKVDNHSMTFPRAAYRLDEQIRQAVVMLAPQWSEKDIEMDAELEEITWRGPESLMLHVWTNLIGNAVKFDPKGGLVRLRLQAQGDFVEVTVEDSGPGIPEAEREAIFGRFYQTDSSHRQEGNGLGLALCKQITRLAGGDIAVENRAAGGSVFRVRLPLDGAGGEESGVMPREEKDNFGASMM